MVPYKILSDLSIPVTSLDKLYTTFATHHSTHKKKPGPKHFIKWLRIREKLQNRMLVLRYFLTEDRILVR